MILIWGLPEDEPLALVRDAILRFGHPVTFLDQRETIRAHVELFVDEQVSGSLILHELMINFRSVSSAYLRPYDSRTLPSVEESGQGSDLWNRALRVEDLILSWAELSPALVIGRPSAMGSNSSKPYQAEIIKSAGFEIPNTLITTDPEAAQEFVYQFGKVMYKSISGVRSIVSHVTEEKLHRLPEVSWCPTQFQEYVPGTDYRVHVVNDDVFICRVVSNADDYRYVSGNGIEFQIEPSSLPENVMRSCVQLSKNMGLLVSGIDLRLTPDNRWYCFEVNPSPGFSYYQEATGLRIDEAIARLLITGMQST